ncbi:MAG: enoyl-CoA hydratase [Deltaproteobacteria bacterium]
MAYRFLTLTPEGKVLTIGLNRPPMNALGVEFGRELHAAFTEVSGMEGISVVVVASLLEKAFIAGADIKEMAGMSRKDSEAFSELLQEANNLLERMRKVTIAAIHGHALGGGCELALACDYRLMAEGKARIGLPEATLGILPGAGGTQRLPRLIGLSRALDILLRGRSLLPEEALSVGLVDRVLPAARFREEVMAFANELASGAGLAMGYIKAAVREGLERPLAEGLAIERKYGLANLGSHDAKEGLLAFAEKRKPRFTGN